VTSAARPGSGPDVVVGDEPIRLEDFVDREGLEELCKGVHALFGIGVRVYSTDGALLGGASTALDLCQLVNDSSAGRTACGSVVSAARSVDPGEAGDVKHPCFTGLEYRVVSLVYEGRRVGRIVLGPYAPSSLRDAPPDLERTVPKLNVVNANLQLANVPRVKTEALGRIVRHLKSTLELLIFSSHKVFVTSKLHLFSVRESYRELEEKTRRLEQALARLKELDRLKSNFLATVSHELRTPLTSIIGYSEMLAEGIAGPLAPEQEEFVRTIHGKGEQLLTLIMGLLDLSKLESGTMPLRHSNTRIEPILSEVVSTLTPAARKKGVELRREPSEAEASFELSGDPERLRQVFVNLVDNALKFTPKGGTVSIRTELAGSGDDGDESGVVLLAPVRRALEVRVADTGIGIPPAERSRVFDAFYQVDSSSTRQFGGTGLGLSIVKRIVEAHGGSVRIEGNQPTGAVFVVTLPSAQARLALPSKVPPAKS
jgi:two-component system sensor histidine kinase BarA